MYQIFVFKHSWHAVLNFLATVENFEYKPSQFYYNPKELRVALVFYGDVKDPKTNKYYKLQGIDLIKLNENGKIVELKVMVRPLNTLIALANEMKAKFLKSKNKKSNL